MKTPIYTTSKDHGPQTKAKRPRRRIGQISDRLKQDLASLDKHTATACKIGAAMTLAAIVNPF